jgi:hypothetical protein
MLISAPAVGDDMMPGDDKISVVLAVGQDAEVERAGVRLRFDQVLEDSRCAQGEECLWEGFARILLTVAPIVSDKARSAATITIDTLGSTASVYGIVLTLVEFEPPNSTAGIPADAYRAKIEIEQVDHAN